VKDIFGKYQAKVEKQNHDQKILVSEHHTLN
jgi:hypothetical protein